MGKPKSHPSGRPPAQPSATSAEQDQGTVFFYMPQEKPYGVFCQWHPNPFRIPIASLQWLVDVVPPPPPALLSSSSCQSNAVSTTRTPMSAAEILSSHASPSPSSPNTNPSIPFTCAEQSYMFCKSLFFSDAATCILILCTSSPKQQKNPRSARPQLRLRALEHIEEPRC